MPVNIIYRAAACIELVVVLVNLKCIIIIYILCCASDFEISYKRYQIIFSKISSDVIDRGQVVDLIYYLYIKYRLQTVVIFNYVSPIIYWQILWSEHIVYYPIYLYTLGFYSDLCFGHDSSVLSFLVFVNYCTEQSFSLEHFIVHDTKALVNYILTSLHEIVKYINFFLYTH